MQIDYMASLKEKTFSGAIWSAIERFSTYGLQFVFSILMARLLTPSDYGTIALLNVFFAVCQTFIDSGFNLAIIRKQNIKDDDFSTAFIFSLVISIISYVVLWFAAPCISDFYNLPELKTITRVVSLNLVISTLSSIHNAKLSINLDFKSKAKASVSAVIGSSCIGLYFAFNNYGVWALVIQMLASNTIRTILLYYYTRWIPLLRFSFDSFKELFSFGSKMLVSGVIGNIYNNLYSIIIGKFYNSASLGFYSKAESFATLPSMQISGVVLNVTYPALSKIQDDNERLLEAYRKVAKLSAFIIFPLMIGLAVLANPLISSLLGAQWMDVIPLLQILCFSYIWDTFNSCNMNLLQLKGHSDKYLKLEIIKKILGLLVLLISLPIGVEAMCIGKVILSLIYIPINTFYSGKMYNYGLLKQLKDLLPILLHSLLMGIIVLISIHFFTSSWFRLLFGFAVGVIYYIGGSALWKMEELKELYSLAANIKLVRNR